MLEYAESESLSTSRKSTLPTRKNLVDKSQKKSPSHEETAIYYFSKKPQKQLISSDITYNKDSTIATATATVAPNMGLFPSASHEFEK